MEKKEKNKDFPREQGAEKSQHTAEGRDQELREAAPDRPRRRGQGAEKGGLQASTQAEDGGREPPAAEGETGRGGGIPAKIPGRVRGLVALRMC